MYVYTYILQLLLIYARARMHDVYSYYMFALYFVHLNPRVADMCPPGSYSHTGLVPCTQCAVGSYQTQRNKKTCTPCPQGFMTENTGSVFPEDCDVVPTGQVTIESRHRGVLFFVVRSGTKHIEAEACFSLLRLQISRRSYEYLRSSFVQQLA